MPEQSDPPGDATAGGAGPLFSAWGVASVVLAVICVAASVLLGVLWSGHDEARAQAAHDVAVARTAADWTTTLINLTPDDLAASLQRLQDGTVGELADGFGPTVAPFSEVVRRLGARSTGQVSSVALEVRHDDTVAAAPGRARAAEVPIPGVRRTDVAMVVASSVTETAGGRDGAAPPPRTVNWRLRLTIADVDGALRIARLELLA